jgi:hypothetical protein
VANETAPGPQEECFAAYIEGLAEVAGHGDRRIPLKNYCTGLLLPGERKSVEPMVPAWVAPMCGGCIRRCIIWLRMRRGTMRPFWTGVWKR